MTEVYEVDNSDDAILMKGVCAFIYGKYRLGRNEGPQNCAKHIIAAGIEKVVYIEPYPKSKALDFYKIEISQDRKDIRKKVVFMPFKGVGPHRFVDLFSMQSIRWYARTRKQTNGYVVDWERNTANLRNPMGLLNYIDMEKSAYNQYAEEITEIGKEDENEYEKNSKA